MNLAVTSASFLGFGALGWALSGLPSPALSRVAPPPAPAVAGDVCEQTAELAGQATRHELFEEFLVARANCINLTDPDQRADCEEEALEELMEGIDEAKEQFDARVDLCELLGGGPYDPQIDPKDFVKSVDNPYLPLVPGTTMIFEKLGTEEVEVMTVLSTTKDILGVECTVVHHTETDDDVLQEDTLDYFAQDSEGNVWYFGELSLEFDDGELAGIEGSWTAGEDGAKAGIIMLAAPRVGDTYRQEFLLTEAEDAGTVLALDGSVVVPYDNFEDCLVTADFSPLEPGNLEEKSYAAGIGLVLEFDPDNGDRLELVDILFN